ncbi:RNA-dependent RNA polymerase 1 [Sphaceloma murrayae]|uniref:RNA-dependent RNA polymerase 1 n=1 Tax=Sphaceloma murrayae TaxID=2082308 RepID=A0A2K1QVS5_9PEZI|nr:RNA-dependent RNA polymerase 1 [Sphaceloma murrayae]
MRLTTYGLTVLSSPLLARHLVYAILPSEANKTQLQSTANTTAVTEDRGHNGNPTSSYCSSLLQNFFSTYSAIEIATTLIPGYEGYGPTDSNGILTGDVTSFSAWTSTSLYTQYPIRAYTAQPPCCSSCYFSAGTMRLLYWPDQASASTPPTTAPRTVVNADGYTFTSPSVYMVFTSIQATNMCGLVGEAWANKTLAFHPDDISTINPYITQTVTVTSTSKGQDVTSVSTRVTMPPSGPIDYAKLDSNCSTISGYTYYSDHPFNADFGASTVDPCHPILEIPNALVSAQQAWVDAGCHASPGAGGIYDPPITLDSANSFMVPTFTQQYTPTEAFQSAAPTSARAATTAEPQLTTRQPSQTSQASQTSQIRSSTTTASVRAATGLAGQAHRTNAVFVVLIAAFHSMLVLR